MTPAHYERGGIRIVRGDCRELMAELPSDSVSAIVTDPPYGLSFMGKGWDHTVPGTEFWTAALRVAKPGAHLVAFGGTRTFHRLVCAIEDAGWEIRDTLMWVYGTGMPKSMDVSKAIDRGFRRDEVGEGYKWAPCTGPNEDVYTVTKFVRDARDASGKTNRQIDALFGFNGMAGHWTSSASQPAVPTWPQWERLKTFLEMSDELDDLVVAFNGGKGDRSIEGTALGDREVIGTATGKDASLGDLYSPGEGVYLKKEYDLTVPATEPGKRWAGWGTTLKPAWEPIVLARKPLDGTVAANFLRHGVGGLNIDGNRIGKSVESWPKSRSYYPGRFNPGELAPDQFTQPTGAAPAGRWPANVIHDGSTEVVALFPEQGADTGSASRFFYCAKASPSDRGHLSAGPLPLFGEDKFTWRNEHATVKPLALMRHLLKLVVPPGGEVLDPFMGSGSSLCAAAELGFEATGFDTEERYCEIAATRLEGKT